MKWIKLALSESDGTPSSQRLMLLILLVFTLNMLACAFFTTGGLPVIPESLSELIKWLFTAIISGMGLGKITGAVQAFSSKPTQTEQNPTM